MGRDARRREKPSEPEVEVLDVAGPILAYRLWGSGRSVEGEPLLLSAGGDLIWPYGDQHAFCWNYEEPCSLAPNEECECGIWGFSNPSYIPRMGNYIRFAKIGGIVALWGKVLRCDWGWRAERARPLLIWWEDTKDYEQYFPYTLHKPPLLFRGGRSRVPLKELSTHYGAGALSSRPPNLNRALRLARDHLNAM